MVNGQCVAPRSYDADTLCPVDDLTLLCDVVVCVDVVEVPWFEQEAMNAIVITAPNKDNMDLFMVLCWLPQRVEEVAFTVKPNRRITTVKGGKLANCKVATKAVELA
jgi:hypothetical protein